MRTTVNLDEQILEEAKRRARARGVPLGKVVEDALRKDSQGAPEPHDLPEIPVFQGTGVRPGVDLTSNRAITEFLDETRDLDQLR